MSKGDDSPRRGRQSAAITANRFGKRASATDPDLIRGGGGVKTSPEAVRKGEEMASAPNDSMTSRLGETYALCVKRNSNSCQPERALSYKLMWVAA